ncbi:hypothetical protein A9Q86_08615 [Flavobacteriales bacterium 33_180_T64]|nr:hypothetical protein A9Q86_08615 [Flavobacteriales bacterium 33_180_T64]
MSETIFTQAQSNSSLYINNGIGVGWSAFLLPKNVEPEVENYTLTEAWELQTASPSVFGYFLFSRSIPNDLSTFIEEAWNYFSKQGSQSGAYVAWFNSPNESPTTKNTILLKADALSFATSIVVDEDVSLLFGGYIELFISGGGNAGVNLSINNEGNAIQLKYYDSIGKIKFEPKDHPGISTVDYEMPLPFDGALRGCFQPRFLLNTSTQAYNSFDIALKYFFPQEENILELSYPIFNTYQSSWKLRFVASLDYWDQLNKNYNPLTQEGNLRTYLAFDGMENTNSGAKENIPIPSQSLTDYGTGMTLKPNVAFLDESEGIQPDAAMLVFSQRKVNVEDSYYLIPQGNFHLGFDTDANPGVATNGQYNALCGISGTETISFAPASDDPEAPYEGDIISFYSGQAAYAPIFPFPEVNLYNPPDYEGDPLLNSDYHTAWLNITPSNSKSNLYSSQPEGSMLYSKDSEMHTAMPEFLGFFEPSIVVTPNTGFCFPMVFYYGFDTDIEADFNGFEFQIILPSRKSIINHGASLHAQSKYTYHNKSLNTEAAPITATTNQGLIVTVENDGQWKELQLAKNEILDTIYQLKFTNLASQLRSAFQTNQQFLVITDNTFLGALNSENVEDDVAKFYNKMSIEEWAFDINTGVDNLYGDYRNVLIFKFCDGTLKDRVMNPQDWTEASNFNATDNNGLTAVSQWLQDYILDAEQRYLEFKNPFYKKFYDIVNDKNWNGILALKVDLNLAELPIEIQGLLAGMDLSNFFGHHLGIEVSRVDITEEIKMEDVSSLFGLIDYNDKVYTEQLKAGDDPNKPVPPDANVYDFKVLTLQVLFENTTIKDFISKAQLTMNELFSDTVVAKPNIEDPGEFSTVVYDGTYENQDGESTYSFNVVDPGQRLFFNNNLLSYISLSKSQFNTLVKEGENGSTQVQTRFLLWGYMHFEAIPNYDVFSFGAENGYEDEGQGYGLAYANLYIAMDFALDTPTVRTFTFNALDVSFDPEKSTSREHSLFPNFALKLNKLVVGTEEKYPGDLGYLPVGVEMNSSRLDGDWYGLELEVNMGGPGELTSAAGFDSTMMLAWTPGKQLVNSDGEKDSSYNAYVGIQLPGTSNDAKLLSIQGVLKIAVGDLFLQYYEDANYFSLRMSDISLKFLGIAKLPPDGYINFFIFGNPDANGKRENLGWYAAYNKNDKKSEATTYKTIPKSNSK